MDFLPLCNIFTTYIFSLLAMAFYTLLERKTLGYSQRRKGPNKISITGVPQPLADAMKLLTKELITPHMSNTYPFVLSPVLSLFLMIFLWNLFPSCFPSFFFLLGVLLFICISSLNIYSTLIAGWTSNSKYSLLGALRSIAQSISYEISMLLILLNALLMIQSLDMSFILSTSFTWMTLISCPLFITWLITILAETNRAPFDFTEGESELVSGFNTEFSASLFTLIFMAEYLSIIFISSLTTIFFFGNFYVPQLNQAFFSLKTSFILFMFLWIRTSYPRFRYDHLMSLTWKRLLPFSLFSLMIILPLSYFP